MWTHVLGSTQNINEIITFYVPGRNVFNLLPGTSAVQKNAGSLRNFIFSSHGWLGGEWYTLLTCDRY